MTDIVRTGYGAEHADCSRCELRGSCKQRVVQGERPLGWEPGGLMLIGEGPGKTEVSLLRPFVGQSGRLLNALLEAAGLDREKCWVTNATLGLPPPGDTALHERFPEAIYSCLPRLEAEIAEARPRVIVTLGQAALVAVAGQEVTRTRLEPNPCANVDCDPETRKLRTPGIECAQADCDWWQTSEDVDAIKLAHGGKCPKCGSSINRLRSKALKCRSCGGKKRVARQYTSFEHDMVLVGRNGVAGAVFEGASLPSRLDELGVKYVIPTYHPSFCLRPASKTRTDGEKKIGGQFAAGVLVRHLEKARKLLREDAVFEASSLVTRDPAVVKAWLARKNVEYACDIETNSKGAWQTTKITVFGVATIDRTEALVVDTREPSEALLDVLQDFLEDEERSKFFHNGQFDRVVIRRLWGMEARGVRTDTIIQHHALYPDEEHNLGFIAHELTDAPHWKVKQRSRSPDELDDLGGYRSFEDLALYNARDTRSTAMIDRVMRGPRGGRGLLDLEDVRESHDVDAACQTISVRMELFGVPLNRERVRALESEARRRKERLLKEMRQVVGETAPDGSPWTPSGSALLWAMFAADGPLKLTPFAYTDGGASGKKQPSTAKEVLAQMKGEHPFVGQLIEYKKWEYVLTNYVNGAALRFQADGRLHPTWKVHGTGTTRWTSNPNFQNWSKAQGESEENALLNLRALVTAPPGRKLVGADYAQLELRVMADLSGDEALIRRLINADEARKLEPEYDPHSYMAWRTFGDAFLNATKEKKKALRDVVKRVVYGLNYGAGAQTVLDAILNGGYDGPPITLQMINLVIATYFKEFPGVLRWRESAVVRARDTQEVRSALLRSRRLFPLGDVDVTVCYNHPIQASAANVMNTRLLVLDRQLKHVDPTAEFFAQVHDAIYVECAEDRAQAVAKVVSEALTCELSLSGGPKMLYAASADIADSWDKC